MSDLHQRLLDHLRDLDVVLDADCYPMTEPVAALRAVLELCEWRMDEAVGGGLTDVDTLWPSEVLQVIARELGVGGA